ncbi:hypothetical protein EZV73_22270 [Acidaminobacter sp. JC074]|uniref:hypothetical protein n=1 Tax=Acidaminobacter sp. JC074 TaxID=2530199 RepID=UPI001F0DF28F|nr:hypothetical protein [Acidaminobacter sp. JC074]MCH4890325.1 hypothetical protein [Acidaminobacter sp. JC074]
MDYGDIKRLVLKQRSNFRNVYDVDINFDRRTYHVVHYKQERLVEGVMDPSKIASYKKQLEDSRILEWENRLNEASFQEDQFWDLYVYSSDESFKAYGCNGFPADWQLLHSGIQEIIKKTEL